MKKGGNDAQAYRESVLALRTSNANFEAVASGQGSALSGRFNASAQVWFAGIRWVWVEAGINSGAPERPDSSGRAPRRWGALFSLHRLGVDGFDDFFGGGPAGHGFGFSVFKHGSVALLAGGFDHP